MKKMVFMRKLIEANKYIPLHSTSRRTVFIKFIKFYKVYKITLKVAYRGLTIILNGQQKKIHTKDVSLLYNSLFFLLSTSVQKIILLHYSLSSLISGYFASCCFSLFI